MNSGLNQDREAPRRPPSDRFSFISTSDPCQHAESLREWSQDYLQLTAGPFSGEILETSTGPVQVFMESISQCVDEKANPRRNCYTVGIPIRVEENGLWQGRALERDSLMTLRPNEELHFRTPRQSSILVTVIDCAAFDQYALNAMGVEVQPLVAHSHADVLQPDAAQRYRMTLSEVLSCVLATPEVHEHVASAKAIAEAVMNASLDALSARSAQRVPSRCGGQSVQRAIIERARNYILTNRENPPTVSELSVHLRMSRRGLHHAFMNVLGINVTTFLRYVRLHGVRKDLVRAQATDSVSGIACKWGFWHMGMFSAYYKALFGETPSATLRRASKMETNGARRLN